MIRMSAAEASRLLPQLNGPVHRSRRSARRESSSPHEILLGELERRYPGRVMGEYPCIPSRRFRLDAAIPDVRVAIECDGWQHHGRFLSDFHRDREKRNLLAADGWLVLAFAAGVIRRDLAGCMAIVDQAVTSRDEGLAHG